MADVDGVQGFMDSLNQLFFQMGQNYAHLNMMSPSIYQYSKDVYVDNLADIAEVEPWRESLLSEQTVFIYDFLDHTDTSTETSENMNFPEVETKYDPNHKAVYFKMTTFAQNIVERDADVVKDYLDTIEDDVENIIFDITGNGGGSTGYWNNNIVEPFKGDYTCENYIYFRDTPLVRCFKEEMLFDAAQPISELETVHSNPEFLKDIGVDYFICDQEGYHSDGQVEERFNHAKRWVLIDRQNYSAAEQFADFCKKTGWATLVGSNTKGDGVCVGSPIHIPLPNTGLIFRFTTEAGENWNGQLSTEAATKPDYMNLRRETALQACYRVIESGESN